VAFATPPLPEGVFLMLGDLILPLKPSRVPFPPPILDPWDAQLPKGVPGEGQAAPSLLLSPSFCFFDRIIMSRFRETAEIFRPFADHFPPLDAGSLRVALGAHCGRSYISPIESTHSLGQGGPNSTSYLVLPSLPLFCLFQDTSPPHFWSLPCEW